MHAGSPVGDAVTALGDMSLTLRGLLDGADGPVFSVDRSYRYTSFNARHADVMRELYGTEIELGRSILDYQTVSADRRAARANLDRALHGEQVTEETFAGEEKRSRRCFTVRHDPIRDDGRIIGVAVHARDAIEQRRADAALLESEQRLRLAQEAGGLGVFDADLVSDVHHWDARTREIWGLGPNESVSKETFLGGLHPDDRERLRAATEGPLDPQAGPTFADEYRVINRRDGAERWVSASGTTLFEEGRPVRTVGFVAEISERKRAEAALRASERKYRELFDNAQMGMFRTRLDGSEMLDVNQRFLEIVGRPREEVLGAPSLSYWDDTEERAEMVRRLEAEGRVTDFECGLLNKQGEVRTCLTSLTLDLRLGILEGSITDITERKRTEEANARLAAIVASSDDAIFRKTLEGTILTWNAGAQRLYGYSAAEIAGKSVALLAPPGSENELAELLARICSGEVIEHYETVRVRKDGSRLDVSLSISPIRDAAGVIVGAATIARDVSPRRQAAEALRESEARYRGYVDNAPYGVFVCDEQGRYVEVNQAAAELMGYTPEELVQLSIADVVAPESREWAGRHFAGVSRTGHASGDGVFLRKDGTTFPAHLDAVRLAATRYLGFLVDISEQTRAAAELEASAAQVKQALTATVAALSATTELRDPYTAGHQRRVAQLAGAIAAGLGWDETRVEIVTTAGLLHDVGKIVVPAEILARPGRLSEPEMQIIRQHPTASAALIAGIEFGGPVAAIVNQHHERLDGSGYPNGFRGETILPEARILAVADVVEAMSSHRPYRPALGMEAALAEVREHAGVQYDADVVAACARLVEEEGFEFTP